MFIGKWENRNISIPDTTNKTAVDEARSKFKFDGPGSFSINLKATKTINEDINYMEVYRTALFYPVMCIKHYNHTIGIC